MSEFLADTVKAPSVADIEISMYNDRKKYCAEHGKTCDDSCHIKQQCDEMRDKLFTKGGD